ncbi:MAG: carbohydrate-binding domain-containing protein [Oscillospiraceae bacterium]|nr:carbohydrate-binding domain-containing protein [Oscillospiraceae bacterium]
MRNITKAVMLVAFAAMITLVFVSCAEETPGETTGGLIVSTTQTEPATTAASATTQDTDEIEADTYIILDDEKTIISGEGAAYSAGTVTITKGGVYSVKGKLTDGKIYINSSVENKKVKLLFCGVDINCTTDAPVFVENSPAETVIILESGTTNVLSDNGDRAIPTDTTDYATATLYSKDDLQIEGEGTLTVNANFNKGIFSKNDIDIRGGVINITAADDGIRGKDSIEVSGGELNITCGGDALRTSEETVENKGDITVSGGKLTLKSDLDGIQATGSIAITGGNINITAAGGATGAFTSYAGDGGRPGDMGGERPAKPGLFGGKGSGKRPPDSSALEAAEEDTPSTKGIKAAKTLTISENPVLMITSVDDSIHGADVSLVGGTLTLTSDDDAIHGDETVYIGGGEINITACYEGVEAKKIAVSDGRVILKSSDDGFNAAGGSTSGTAGGFMGMKGGMDAVDSDCDINITGGFVLVNADGDGIDSNGNVEVSGGTLVVFGPVSDGNAALDYAGKFTVSGGTVLAAGSSRMAQSVTGDGVRVFAFNYTQQANTLVSILDGSGKSLIGFVNPKSYTHVVFASDAVDSDESCYLYESGSYSSQGFGGVYVEGDYTGGNLERELK